MPAPLRPDALKVGVIVDWARSSRGSYWQELLARLNDGGLANVTTTYPLADLILAPSDGSRKFLTQSLDVLIINWDAANGDPEFGSHSTQRWLDHRRPEIMLWIRRNGGILIIEGQAVLSVPSQPAFDALVGKGELPVCGAEDQLNPMKQKERMKGKCRKTKWMQRMKGFEDLPDEFTVQGRPTHDMLFPGTARNLLTAHISDTRWENVLYRGWFRKKLPRGDTFPWISIVETADRPRGKNQSTMKVAKLGKGAVFATTMFLATTQQDELVRSMLGYFGHTEHILGPTATAERLRTAVKYALPFIAALGLGYFTNFAEFVLDHFGISHADNGAITSVVKILVVPVGLIVFEIGLRLFRLVRSSVRDFIGY